MEHIFVLGTNNQKKYIAFDIYISWSIKVRINLFAEQYKENGKILDFVFILWYHKAHAQHMLEFF